jgi:hypothetical protein
MATAGLLIAGLGAVAEVRAQTVEELKQRILELERSTREQVETLKRMIEQQEAARAQERASQEDRERVLRALQEQVERQRASLERQEERIAKISGGLENFFELQAGSKQGADQDRNPLGREILGNVYAGDEFKVRLGGSLRLHIQRNDTPVGESVASALLPDPTVPGGGNNADRENFRVFAGRSRLNLAIAGPMTLVGKTLGFFEMDFNRQFSAGEGGAVNNNPRLRHAFGRWRFADLLANGDELSFTFGQTGSFADNVPDTVDFNNQLAGLGAVNRRNPRIELVHKYPVTSNGKLLTSVGFERPFFGNDFIGTDLGPGDLSGFPALSGGIGLETGRIGEGFGIGSTAIYLRTTWGEFEERFTAGPAGNLGAQTDFSERRFTNQAVHGAVILDRIGFNKTGRAMTLKLLAGGLWTRGDALHLDASFDRRLIIDSDGELSEAQSAGGFINPIFYLTDALSIRWASGVQFALDNDRTVVTGALTNNFFRVNNRQSEVSIWWTPGPFTFALSYNHTATDWRRVFTTGGSESRENESNKIEFISWFSF